MIDIDNFKNVNDEFGHQIGDNILKRVAKILVDVARRPEDTVCRYGGEEFVVILANTPEHGAYDVAEDIRDRIEKENIPAASNSLYDFLSVSIGGCTVVPDIGILAKGIILSADNALYSAKMKGKNCVFFSDEKV
jgi:diguanylate cyclase (GGDEF)-like protein